MRDNWCTCRWGDLATLEYGKALRGYEYGVGQYPVYGTNGLIGRNIEPLCKHPGVIIGRKGAYRGVHYSKVPFFVIDTAFYLEPKTEIDLTWAYYELLTQDINSMDSGSAIPSTSRDSFYNLHVRVPPLSEQHAIAHILGTLDNKIELNRRLNETLEAMARALFKSWFVDFDPVRAKAEDRQPEGLDADTAALFPASFEDSALGEIPKGWRVGNIGDLASNRRIGVDPSQLRPGTPYIGLEHMPRKSIALFEWGQADGVASNKFRFSGGDLLFGKLRPYFHKVGVAPLDGVCSTDILVIFPKKPHHFALALAHVSSEELIQYVDAASTGTKMPRTNWKDIAHYEMVIPGENVMKKLDDEIRPMIDSIKANIHESRTLAAIRDALLPKLLSGVV